LPFVTLFAVASLGKKCAKPLRGAGCAG